LKGKFTNKDNTNATSYHVGGVPCHMLKDCPLFQKIGENPKFKIKKDNTKATVATWSDNKSSQSKRDEEHTTNICLMTKEVEDDKETEYAS